MSNILSDIARDILADWAKPHFAAKPYLGAMLEMRSIQDNYGYDDGRDVVLRFLANAGGWRGAKAREIKKMLRAMVV